MKISPPSKQCLVCGDLFYKRRYESRKYWQVKKFCSRECSDKDRVGKHFSPNTQFKKGRILTDEQKEHLKGSIPWNKGIKGIHLSPNSEFKKGHGNKGQNRVYVKGEGNPSWVPRILTPCFYCKKEIPLAPHQVNKRNFCDRKCWALGTKGLKKSQLQTN